MITECENYEDELSDTMSSLVEMLSMAYGKKIDVLYRGYYEKDDVEYIETPLAMFHIIKNGKSLPVLIININLECDLNTICRLGMYLGPTYDKLFSGFRYSDPYRSILNEDTNEINYVYGEDTKPDPSVHRVEKILHSDLYNNMTYDLLRNADIDSIPSC